MALQVEEKPSAPTPEIPHTDGEVPETIPSVLFHNEDTTALWLPHPRPRRSISHRMLRIHVQHLRTQLATIGVGHGDLVVLIMPNSYEFIIAFMAIAAQAATILPLNPDLTVKECQAHLETVSVKLLMEVDMRSGQGRVQKEQGSFPTCTHALLTIDADPVLRVISGPLGSRVPVGCPTPQDPVLYLHTSGTTGLPKVVPLTHLNLMSGIRQVCRSCRLTARDCGILVMPLFHVHGLVAGLLAPLMVGGSVVIRGRFSASTAVNVYHDIDNCGGTWYTAVPAIHRMVLEAPLEDHYSVPSLRFIRSCSAPLDEALLVELERRFGTVVLQAYGMTEASHQVASNSAAVSDARRLNTVGRADAVEIQIIDSDGCLVQPNTIGQIVIRGESVTTGYLGGKEASQKIFTTDGFLQTGDLGHVDEAGFLTLTGRLKEFINRGGEKINPYEIKRRVCAHEDVVDACAVPYPSKRYGEEVALHVVVSSTSALTEEMIQHYIGEGLAHFKVPSRVWKVLKISRTSTGKLQRRRVVAKVMAILDEENSNAQS